MKARASAPAGAALVVLALVLALSACGLSGNSANSPVTEPPAAPVPRAESERTVSRPEPVPLEDFDAGNAMADLRAIEAFGVRQGGSAAEAEVAAYIARRLTEFGYTARIDEFPIVGGRTSRNVVARSEGRSERVLVIGAHMDSKPPSPGANDNASGCGVVLEIARILASRPVTATVEIVFFGTEELVGGPGEHHLGSAYYVEQMNAEEQANTAGMLSVDMIAVGENLHSRTMLRGPQTLSDFVLAQAAATGLKMTFLKDPGRTGWSDHGPFELAGMPAVALNRQSDPAYHTEEDTSERIDPEMLRIAGQLVLDICRALDEPDLERLIIMSRASVRRRPV
ncbi:MAG: M28 family peptidase [Coriobacteriia bacterium]|nr:M28 family peptidase [Coriobacteriia bacterium]